VLTESLTGLDLSATTHTGAGDYPDGWMFTDVTGNYNNTSGSVNDVIDKANAVVNVSGTTVTYDGNAHGATGTAVGVESPAADLNALLHIGESFTDFPGGTANWTFDGNGNYNSASGSVAIVINKADAVISVPDINVIYDGDAHCLSGTAAGIESTPANLTALLTFGTCHTDAPGGSSTWGFAGNNNYNPANGIGNINISKANALVSVTPYAVVYNGSPHTATGSATGVKGEDLS
jgi:hypothetical protein